MKTLAIRQRLFLLALVPLLALAVTTVNLIRNAWQEYGSATTTRDVLKVAVAAGNLIHTLQVERGATAGFLQSQGAKFADKLPGIRGNTDKHLAAFSAELDVARSLDAPALATSLGKAGERLDALQALRAQADAMRIPVPDAVAAYTATITSLIDVIGTSGKFSASAEVVLRSTAYLGLVRAKEQAGQERALTTAAFAADSVDAQRLRTILERHHRQDAYLDIFRATADPDGAKAMAGALDSAAAQEVQRLRGVLIAGATTGGFGVEPTHWFDTITQKIDALHGVEAGVTQGLAGAVEQLVARSRMALIGYIVLSLVAIVLVMVASSWVARSIAKPLQAQVEVAEFAIGRRDFTRDVPESGPAEVLRAGHAFNQLMHTFRQIIGDMKVSSERVTAAAHTLSGASQTLRASSEAQADATASVAAAVEQASTSVSETNSNAEDAARRVAAARRDTQAAMTVMADTVRNVRHIAELIRESSGRITELDEDSQRIGGIVQVIKEIAEQTNLLALNAAIEAARAGEQGRGFAVVADEVRKLAERTAKSTGEIGSLITTMQAGVSNSVEAMAVANRQADSSLTLVGETESALARIDHSSEEVAQRVLAISDALRQQDGAIRQIAVSIEQIAQMTDRNTLSEQNNDTTAHELEALAGDLRTSVGRFRT